MSKSHINNICDTRNLLKWIRGSPPPQVAHNYSRKLITPGEKTTGQEPTAATQWVHGGDASRSACFSSQVPSHIAHGLGIATEQQSGARRIAPPHARFPLPPVCGQRRCGERDLALAPAIHRAALVGRGHGGNSALSALCIVSRTLGGQASIAWAM